MKTKKASEIKEGDVVNFWPGFAPNQTVSRVAEIHDRKTQAEFVLIEVDSKTNDGLKWPPNTEIHVSEQEA
jgi:hypothetical protein